MRRRHYRLRYPRPLAQGAVQSCDGHGDPSRRTSVRP